MAGYLEREAIAPGLVLCSSAVRTRETLERLGFSVGDEAEVVVERGLYAASATELLERLRGVEPGVDSVMLIGHNPGMQELALALAGSGDELDAVRRKFPTGALVSMTFDGPWSELGPGSAELVGFVRPRELG